MPKCILHLGMNRTGSTSIQLSLQNLDDDKFYYAKLGDRANHSSQILSAFTDDPELARGPRARYLGPAVLKHPRRQIFDWLESSIKGARDRTLIISGEGIMFMSAAELGKFRAFLERHGCDTEVVAYVRTPCAYMSSVFQQIIKFRKVKRLNFKRMLPNYRARMSRLDSIFGRNNVKLIKFDPARFPDNDVVRDLCTRLGISACSVKVHNYNTSMPLGLCKLIFQYNSVHEERNLPALNARAVKKLAGAFTNLAPLKLQFTDELIAPVLESIADDVEWMEERLGEPLSEEISAAAAGPIGSLDDLLQTVEGARDTLLKAIAADGCTDLADRDEDVCALIAKFALRGQLPKSPQGTSLDDQAERRGRVAQHIAGAARKDPTEDGRISSEPQPQDDGTSASQPKVIAALPPAVLKSHPLPLLPITRPAPPLLNMKNNLVVLWSAKSACTTVYVWFSHVSGFSQEVRDYASWPHQHRTEQYEKSPLYLDSARADLSRAHTLRIIRDPYDRAVSIFRHALQTHFADKVMNAKTDGRMSAEAGYSFLEFLDFVARLDMNRVDHHFRPQFHPYEKFRKPDRVINISKQDLFAELVIFEREAGLPPTNFKDLDWLRDLESKRKANQDPLTGSALDTIRFTRHQVHKLGQFPSYVQLLTPEAKQKIETIYKIDFDAYRVYL